MTREEFAVLQKRLRLIKLKKLVFVRGRRPKCLDAKTDQSSCDKCSWVDVCLKDGSK